jgi:aerobic-type carbon monoxide dehydrogenase small subunit (CoxS/CutS family)
MPERATASPVTIRFTVNGQIKTVTTHPQRPLLDVLREDLELTGAKYGCGENRCGACTVLIDGKPALTCRTPVRDVANATIVTIEGLATNGRLHPVQQAFLEKSAFQCGYCTPGMILTTVAFLDNNPNPTDTEICKALDANLCRCCGHLNILAAVHHAAQLLHPPARS